MPWTYDGAPRGLRYDAWREEVCRGFCRIDVQPSDGERINCKVEIDQLSSLSLASARGISGHFSRTRELLRDGNDSLVLITATTGRVLVTQNQRPIELAESQMCLTDMSLLVTVALQKGGRFSVTRIPRRELLSICPKAETQLAKLLGENPGLSATIAHYSTLAAAMATRLDAVGQRLSAQHLTDLIGLLLGTDSDQGELARERGLAAAQLQLIQSETLKDLSDSTLTIAGIAKRCGVSPRQVQRLFERTGTTFTEFVLAQRLLLARKLLVGPFHPGGKISAVAYDAGFNDLSYFNRAFRKRFGATPSELRCYANQSGSERAELSKT